MFQLTISVNSSNTAVCSAFIKNIIYSKVTDYSVCINSQMSGMVYVCFGAEQRNKNKIISTVKECLVKVYLTVIKKEYMEKHLRIFHASKVSQLLLLNTLVAFDRVSEDSLLRDELELGTNFNIDGFFNFRMTELKNRWRDVCKLASEHSEYLSSEDTVNELLKFLITAVNSKVSKAEIRQDGNSIEVVEYASETPQLITFDDYEQLMLYLIDTAPKKIIIKGYLKNKYYRERISHIFDAVENYF